MFVSIIIKNFQLRLLRKLSLSELRLDEVNPKLPGLILTRHWWKGGNMEQRRDSILFSLFTMAALDVSQL